LPNLGSITSVTLFYRENPDKMGYVILVIDVILYPKRFYKLLILWEKNIYDD
jgi:hypothetical protein